MRSQQLAIAADAWSVEVAAGPNHGAAVALPQGRYTIGSGPGNDIVLADPSIALRHLELEIVANGAALIAIAPGATLRPTRSHMALSRGIRLRTGSTRALRPGMELHLGQTRLRFAGPTPSSARRRGPTTLLVLLLLGGVVGSAGAYRATSPASRPARAALATLQASAPVTSEQAASRFGHYLADTGLTALSARAEAGAVLVEGSLIPPDQPRWADAQRWFDTSFGSRVALVASIGGASADKRPTLDVAAVSITPMPHVITRDGQRYMEGAVLAGGWVIASITAERITLRAGNREIGITL